MAKYIAVEEEVIAHRWYKDIEHTGVGVLRASSNKCPRCNSPMSEHGWLFGRMEFVCPGTWIVMDSYGDTFQMQDEVFQRKYRRVE